MSNEITPEWVAAVKRHTGEIHGNADDLINALPDDIRANVAASVAQMFLHDLLHVVDDLEALFWDVVEKMCIDLNRRGVAARISRPTRATH